MASWDRIRRASKSLHRFREVLACFTRVESPFQVLFAYLGISSLKYPYNLRVRGGGILALRDWTELTTAWVVLMGEEYRVHRDDKVIFDLGANIGTFSLMACLRAPNARIIALEPFPDNFDQLNKMIRENGWQDRVLSVGAAVMGQSGKVQMDASPDIPSHSRYVGASQGTSIEVTAITLSDLLAQTGCSYIDLLKIDIEGAEYDLIRETPDSVFRKISRIGLEYHDNGRFEDLHERLVSLGYKLTYFPKKGTSGVCEYTQMLTTPLAD